MRNSIRTRLTVAFIGLAIGPLLLVGIILAWQSFTTQERQALDLQREVAQRVATEITAFFAELENELRLMSKVQMWPGLGRNAPHSILPLLMSQHVFEELVLLDSQGQEKIHLSRLGLSATSLGYRAEADEFVIPQTTGEVYYSPIRFEEITGEPLMTIAVPLLDVRTGLVDGVLISEVRLKKIWDLIANVRASKGQSVYIVDAQGKVVAHRNPSVVLRGTTFAVPNQDSIQPGLNGSSVVLAVDTVRLGQQEFNIIVEQAVSDALVLAINTVLITIILVVAAFAVSSTLGFLIVRQIIRPIQAMATTAQAISAGDLSRQVQVTSRDEVGVLAAAFNSMTAQLGQSMKSLEQQIVEVKQAEESLRQANETLQALIDYSPLAIIMLDLNGHILLWNNAAEKMYGWTAQEALGKFIPFVPEDKREELRAIRERVTQGDIFTDLELEWRHKDGSRILVGVSIAPLRDSTGSVYAHMSIATDITKRKKAEQALRESEERLRQIASSLREVIWLRDVQTRQVLYVNPAFEELTGRTCESFYENRDIVIDATHPDDKERVSKALEQRFEDEPFDKEHRIIHLDGSVRWVSSRIFPVRNEAGEVYRWASLMEDITERKQAEEEIRRLNEVLEQRVARRTRQIETVVEISKQLTSILDLQTLLSQVVTITKETFNYYHVHIYLLEEESKTLIMAQGYGEAGDKMKEKGHQIPLDAPTSLVARAARQHEIVLVDDVRQAPDWLPNPLLPDTCSEMAVPIIAEEVVLGVLDVQSDQVAGLDEKDKDLLRSLANHVAVAMTNAQLYKKERELRQTEAERAQELAKLNEDLKATQAELLRQERLATLGKLTATVSHEIRNPLASIRASAFALDRKTRDKALGVERALDRIQRGITRCDNIITELLDYTRRHDLKPQLIVFDEWLKQVLAEQTILAGITLSTDLVAGVEVSLDPECFRRVIVNLVVNACQAMQETVKSNDREQILTVQTEVTGEQLKVSIADTGPGIPPEILSHIFEPLYSTKGFGVGLGLSIVKEIVKQHGGEIEISSEVGKGTQVVVWLPLGG